MDVSSSDGSSPLQYPLYGNGKLGADVPPGGSQNQLLERQVFILRLDSFVSLSRVIEPMLYLCSQKAHVQQFLATEDALNNAAEARDLSEKLMKRLHGGTDVTSRSIGIGATSQNVGSLRQLQVLFI